MCNSLRNDSASLSRQEGIAEPRVSLVLFIRLVHNLQIKTEKEMTINIWFIIHPQETMGRVAWRPSRSWPLRRACASPTRTRSTATPERNTLIAFWGNYANVCPKLVWWCVSARAWRSAVSWWLWDDSGCMGNSFLLAGMVVFACMFVFSPHFFNSQFRAPCWMTRTLLTGWETKRGCFVFRRHISPRQPGRIRPHINSTE